MSLYLKLLVLLVSLAVVSWKVMVANEGKSGYVVKDGSVKFAVSQTESSGAYKAEVFTRSLP